MLSTALNQLPIGREDIDAAPIRARVHVRIGVSVGIWYSHIGAKHTDANQAVPLLDTNRLIKPRAQCQLEED